VQLGYPRPQLQREHWQSLNGGWRFLFDPERRYREPWEIRDWSLAMLQRQRRVLEVEVAVRELAVAVVEEEVHRAGVDHVPPGTRSTMSR
jgi:hypothetical protein